MEQEALNLHIFPFETRVSCVSDLHRTTWLRCRTTG